MKHRNDSAPIFCTRKPLSYQGAFLMCGILDFRTSFEGAARGSRAADGDDHAAARVTAGGRLSRAALAAWQPFGREPDRFTG
jgi:hypothetical protein